jgi:microsomal dipeptidase-like Zn-dependent dipeptidase
MHRLGQVRERTFENQQNRVSGLNLVTAAIILWNTVQLTQIAERQNLDSEVLEHLSPLGWDHIGLSGDYNWAALGRDVDRSLPLDFFRSVP